jgi:hypothetical protein
MTFTVANVLYITNTIDELLYMGDIPPSVEITRACDEKNRDFLRLTFTLKNGKSEINIFEKSALFYYNNDAGEIVSSTSFTNDRITDTNGSFHLAFKYIRSVDRQQTNNGNIITISSEQIANDRPPLALVNVNNN